MTEMNTNDDEPTTSAEGGTDAPVKFNPQLTPEGRSHAEAEAPTKPGWDGTGDEPTTSAESEPTEEEVKTQKEEEIIDADAASRNADANLGNEPPPPAQRGESNEENDNEDTPRDEGGEPDAQKADAQKADAKKAESKKQADAQKDDAQEGAQKDEIDWEELRHREFEIHNPDTNETIVAKFEDMQKSHIESERAKQIFEQSGNPERSYSRDGFAAVANDPVIAQNNQRFEAEEARLNEVGEKLEQNERNLELSEQVLSEALAEGDLASAQEARTRIEQSKAWKAQNFPGFQKAYGEYQSHKQNTETALVERVFQQSFPEWKEVHNADSRESHVRDIAKTVSGYTGYDWKAMANLAQNNPAYLQLLTLAAIGGQGKALGQKAPLTQRRPPVRVLLPGAGSRQPARQKDNPDGPFIRPGESEGAAFRRAAEGN